MVQITIRVRPQRGYTFPKAIKTATVDSSLRLEDLLGNLRIAKRGTAIYLNGAEKPLNSSLATHNVQDGDMLETCSSPFMSAVLSAVISDLEAVQKVDADDRTTDVLKRILDNPPLELPNDLTTDRWTHEHVKRRSIGLKILKKALQRNDRFAHLEVPHCADLQQLYRFMKDSVFKQDGEKYQFNTMEHVFKPSARNRNGEPSLGWVLLEHKLAKFHKMAAKICGEDEDLIEAFVAAENNRRPGAGRKPPSPPAAAGRGRTLNGKADSPSAAARSQRHLPAGATSAGNGATSTAPPVCASCNTQLAECMCLDATCAFAKAPACSGCFVANHPPLLRNHERVQWDDRRVKAVLKELSKQDKTYCPEFTSGPFAILSTLYEAMNPLNTTVREFNLNEKILKERSQTRCRSNLYDRQARGRSAFACIEKLTSDGYLRKEMVPGRRDEEAAKYSLLPKGEKLGKFCHKMEQCVQKELRTQTIVQDQSRALGNQSGSTRDVSIVIDTREDNLFAERLKNRCEKLSLNYDLRGLPTGDYIFTTTNGAEDEVLYPLLIERKTWSDLADSVVGKGQRRLDCVKLGSRSTAEACGRHCQLCKMKKSGVSRLMFIIEGARCSARDGQENKCTAFRRCQYCTELQERHGNHVFQQELEEKVLHRLQAEHRCIILFSRDYNQTIDALLTVRDIFQAGNGNSNLDAQNLAYNEFATNARRRNTDTSQAPRKLDPRGEVIEWSAQRMVAAIFSGKMCNFVENGHNPTNNVASNAPQNVIALEDFSQPEPINRSTSNDMEVIAIDDDDDGDSGGGGGGGGMLMASFGSRDSSTTISAARKPAARETETIALDSDSEDEVMAWNESQNSVEIIGSSISATLMSSEATKKRELEVPSVAGLSPARKRRRTQQPNRGLLPQRRHETKLMVLTGTAEYDQDFLRDISKIWKYLYQKNMDNEGEFDILVRRDIQEMQKGANPFVERQAIMFWILFIQLQCPILIYTSRFVDDATQVRACWADVRRGEGSPQVSSSSASHRPRASPDRSIARLASINPSVEPMTGPTNDCVICFEALGTTNTEAILCGHCFHRDCLQKWYRIGKAHTCPVCKFQVRGPEVAERSNTSGQRQAATQVRGVRDRPLIRFHQTQHRRRTAPSSPLPQVTLHIPSGASPLPPIRPAVAALPPPNPQTRKRAPKRTLDLRAMAQAEIREVRLRRFAEPEISQNIPSRTLPAATTNSPSPARARISRTTWACEVCTFENPESADQCTACNSIWRCSECSMQNQVANAACLGCVKPNATKSVDPPVASPPSCSTQQLFREDTEKDDLPRKIPAVASMPTRQTTPQVSEEGRSIRCGACREFGHNRGSATQQNCPAYNTPKEIQLRQDKADKAMKKEEEAKRAIEAKKRDAEEAARMNEAVKAGLESAMRLGKANEAASKREMKLLEKKRERLARQRRKHQG